MAEKLFTRQEIEKNNDIEKTMFILHDKVYNVHSFLNEHPGGEEILLDHRGKDASEDFDDVGHSKDAMELMKKYQVGVLVDSERNNTIPKQPWVSTRSQNKQKNQESLPIGLFLGAFVVIIAGLYYFF